VKKKPWVIGSFILLLCLAAGCRAELAFPPAKSFLTPTFIPPLGTASSLNTASACTEAGILQKGIAAGQDGFNIPFQAYLPPCYGQGSLDSYPILFLISTDEDVWFTRGKAAELADRMINEGEISPFIIVTTRTDFSRLDTLFLDFVDVLVPYIDSNFRTMPDRRDRAVAGGSGAADMASCVVLKYPEGFASIGAFAGGGCLEMQDLMDAIPKEQRPRVFLDFGDKDPEIGRAPVWAKALAENGFQFVLNIGSGNHSFEYWSGNLEMFLLWWARGW
jgi:enterochelin esterase-like enzyme